VKPRVGISRCLLGDDVRYDATNRRSRAVDEMGAQVEWIPVCPEVEVGMVVPREPIQLVTSGDGVRSGREMVRLLGVHSREDWTARMDQWTRLRVAELKALHIDAFVLKAARPAAALLVCLCSTTQRTPPRPDEDCSPKR